MDNLLKFNEEFPNSTYREIKPQYTGDVYELYQQSKAPMNNNIISFDDIKNTKNRIGWIVPEEYIVVDIDNTLDSKKAFDILLAKHVKFSYTMSKKGGHFIFKNDVKFGTGAGYFTSIGIKIDTRSMGKGYIILPHNDTDRKWGTISNNVDNIPYFLKPLKHIKLDRDLNSLGNGDGRNDLLYRHFLNLKDYADELTIEEKINSINLINEYILKEKLTDKELKNTVLREDVIEKEPTKKVRRKRMSEEEIATLIMGDKLFITSDGLTYIYNGKYYKETPDIEIERMIHETYDPDLLEHSRKEVIKFIKLKSYVPNYELNKNWNEIVVKNGIINISEGKLYPHTSTQLNTCYVDHNFIQDSPYSHIVDKFFSDITFGDIDKTQLLYEIIGYTLLRRNVFSKFFICYGGGQTGKSTYLNIIKKLIGDLNTTHLTISDLETSYNPAELFGKLVNLGDDIDFKRINNTSFLKKLTSGESVMARRIYGEPFTFVNFATLIWTTNEIPNMNDKSTGLYRRMILIDLNRKIAKPDPFFLDKLTNSDMEYLLFKSVEAVKEALKIGRLTESVDIQKALEEYKISQSSVLSFINDNQYTANKLENRVVADVYNEYKEYCIEEAGMKALNRINFKRDVCDALGLVERNTTYLGDNQQRRFIKR